MLMVSNMCQKSIFHKSYLSYNLNDRYIGDNPLNFCPKLKCPKISGFNVVPRTIGDNDEIILLQSNKCGAAEQNINAMVSQARFYRKK